MSTRRCKRYVYLTLQQRLDILLKLENGAGWSQLAKEYNTNVKTIRRIKLNEAQIRKQSQIPEIQGLKRLRTPILVELEARLHSWYLQQRKQDVQISDQLLREKATELNRELGGPPSFTGSKGLIWMFKRRHGIHLHERRDEGAWANTAQEFSRSFLQRLEENNIDLQNVYSMDETTLMWKAVPEKISGHSGEDFHGNKIYNERVTVGVCADATGTHMLLPVLVSKDEGPKVLKCLENRLPVVFKTQENASMDQDVFVDWLENDFKPAVRRQQLETGISGKVLLLVDTCQAHVLPTEEQDENGEVVFFPAIAASVLLPMGQGIIDKLKRRFRHHMLKKILDFPGGLKEFSKDYDIKDCINILSAAWLDVTQVNICQAWKKILADRTMTEQESQGDEEEDSSIMSTIIAMTETVTKIAEESVSQEEVEEWLIRCFKEEDDADLPYRDHKVNEESCPKRKPQMTQAEVDNMFDTLVSWSETQPEYIKLQVYAIRDSYQYTKK